MLRAVSYVFDQVFVLCGLDDDGLLKQAVEQLATRTRTTAVETKGELVEVVVQVLMADGPLVPMLLT